MVGLVFLSRFGPETLLITQRQPALHAAVTMVLFGAMHGIMEPVASLTTQPRLHRCFAALCVVDDACVPQHFGGIRRLAPFVAAAVAKLSFTVSVVPRVLVVGGVLLPF
jgi:hypothetical protein